MEIEVMRAEHTEAVLEMMRVFYTSPAVWTDGSEEIYRRDVESCVGDCPYLDGYVFTEAGTPVGYAMVAKGFSTEFGKPCLWIEDLYLVPSCRGKGMGSRFFAWLEERNPGVLFRLEVEAENERALETYRRNGFDFLPYLEMKK